MNLRTSAIVLLCLATPALAAAGDAPGLRQFALASCLARAFEGSPAGEDARRAAGAILELGGAPFEAYEAADQLALQALASLPAAKAGPPIATLACLVLQDSAALRALEAPYRPRPE